jgi:hypothetical protein
MLKSELQLWKQSRLDLAEHVYAKWAAHDLDIDPYAAEAFAEVNFEIGSSLSRELQQELSLKWLERANGMLEGKDPGLLSGDADELRLAILQKMSM